MTQDQTPEAATALVNDSARLIDVAQQTPPTLRRIMATSLVDLAAGFYALDVPTSRWEDADLETRRTYIFRANSYQREARIKLAQDDADTALNAALEAYHFTLVQRCIPVHRWATREGGFTDGWEAAMAHVKASK